MMNIMSQSGSALLGSTLVMTLAACATASGTSQESPDPALIANVYPAPGDTGQRAPARYFLRRAWVQLTRDLSTTRLPETLPLHLAALEGRHFAVAWLGHATTLVRAGTSWILMDPALFTYVGPVAGFGPRRLTPLPIPAAALPHIDAVLISHDHFDHLDLASVRHLAAQAGGPPRFLVGRGLGRWFAENVGVVAEEFDWWDRRAVGDALVTFVPAQHSSGRTPWRRNETRWGGWVVGLGAQRFYFPGDTSYVAQLFQDLRARVGEIQLAALPIGAYSPREWMRFEHLDPEEAVLAHLDLGAARSIGVHWATFQLGDEEPYQPALDLARAVEARGARGFDVVPLGLIVDVPEPTPPAVSDRPSLPVAATTPEERHVHAHRPAEAN
jgi:L-ascorbate metabolism protein UlaG (beta-lactamase superfamily)